MFTVFVFCVKFELIFFFFGFRRAVIVKEPGKPGEDPIDVTPKDFAVRTLAQEYGGGDFCIQGDILIFSNYKDQRLYKQSISSLGLHFPLFSMSLNAVEYNCIQFLLFCSIFNISFDGETILFMYIFGIISSRSFTNVPYLICPFYGYC